MLKALNCAWNLVIRTLNGGILCLENFKEC
nr:MAG TPA: hypothetical protein [Caudoviricetes sp.]DAL59758.1 MAG TPA_asm: hypothetical protein [Caudoviricetes sp.]DAU71247.1 MAG TPA: hypothetical protein [Caudoviricetes sp.]DAV30365.1 MAG TPA: hypothetical protein [Caudoviricetes sp.]